MSASGSSRIRTGTRCSTFTQFPVAFCAGNRLNSAPVPAPMASTVPESRRSGAESSRISTLWPRRISASWLSLKFASTQLLPVSTRVNSVVPAATICPGRNEAA